MPRSPQFRQRLAPKFDQGLRRQQERPRAMLAVHRVDAAQHAHEATVQIKCLKDCGPVRILPMTKVGADMRPVQRGEDLGGWPARVAPTPGSSRSLDEGNEGFRPGHRFMQQYHRAHLGGRDFHDNLAERCASTLFVATKIPQCLHLHELIAYQWWEGVVQTRTRLACVCRHSDLTAIRRRTSIAWTQSTS
ncbi:hypothetical protein GN244_ATG00181 [Phytophthora infestans]|uniref:Uncharacterized protein n=1 Tax=Phytophthora infestans TaxID=4787 RepID=A0A833TD05_PHYIN|nr:hypothetical protein GN244_ATG00181 [Phytophthora infestans]